MLDKNGDWDSLIFSSEIVSMPGVLENGQFLARIPLCIDLFCGDMFSEQTPDMLQFLDS